MEISPSWRSLTVVVKLAGGYGAGAGFFDLGLG